MCSSESGKALWRPSASSGRIIHSACPLPHHEIHSHQAMNLGIPPRYAAKTVTFCGLKARDYNETEIYYGKASLVSSIYLLCLPLIINQSITSLPCSVIPSLLCLTCSEQLAANFPTFFFSFFRNPIPRPPDRFAHQRTKNGT